MTSWHDYLATVPAERYRDCRHRQEAAFASQKRLLDRVCRELRPRTVACLGAGVLNDIPYAALVRAGATISLVDWLPDAIRTGLASSIVEAAAGGAFSCVFCSLGDDEARAYCQHFEGDRDSGSNVCANFELGQGEPPSCAAFALGERPAVLGEDVTGGYASAFAETIEAGLAAAESWRQAFSRAAGVAKKAMRRRRNLDIPDGSIDLVTSSMLISQFESEPYAYFSRQAEARLGRMSLGEEDRLRPAMERLRSTLLAEQIRRHCDEIERILAPDGRCFMSFEMFHFDAGTGRWFLVREMHRALAYLADRFVFEFDVIGDGDSVCRFQNGDEGSLVYSFLLAPQPRSGGPRRHGIG